MSYPKGKARVSNTRCRPPNHKPQKFGGGLGYCRENATDTNVPDCVGCTRDSDIVEQSAREVVREVRHCGFAFSTKVVYMKRRGKAKKSITHSSSAQYNYYRQQRSFQLPAHILYHHIHSLHNTIFDFLHSTNHHHHQIQNAVLHHLRCHLCSRLWHGRCSPNSAPHPSQRSHPPRALARHCRPLGGTFLSSSPSSYISSSSPGVDRTSASRASTTRLASRSRRYSRPPR